MSDAIERLRTARERVEAAEAAVERHARDQLEAVESAHRTAMELLDRYEDTATGTGDFQSFVTFQDEFTTTVEGLDDDLPRRDAFEEALDAVDQRRLSESDFAAARAALQPASELVGLLDEEREARAELREAEREAKRRLQDIEDAIAERERLVELGEADLDAPVERLRDPIAAFNEAVVAAFADYRTEVSARELLEFAASAAHYPLVDVQQPPADLVEYVESHEAGTETVPRLLELADYSPSKLDHYVDDATALKRAVATRQTYLDRLDGSSLQLDWPPGPAAALRRRCEERIPLVSRVADEEVVAMLRTVRELTWDDEYERLRTAAVALDELDDEGRERLASGSVADELADLREERETLQAAL
ncbi:DUF7118 family protein [Haloarchaeobius iranensis]|uniref:Uncharacterized protein n=1 Tax=Haloarchaeobius iranensis TaxID=996166 RepID=A0A1G9SHE9_9EURY|nr:hypothetical protein [Haloarchaeobius iranensis]SDM34926.1 hypothetical protein SAMN05192554_101194 [Haloarchaeobius iranensis]